MAKKQSWFVRLGTVEWSRHTYARPKDDSLVLLGSVRRGMQIGALAKSADGAYFQVVGDFLTPLNRSKIEMALAKAKSAQAYSAPHAPAYSAPAPTAAAAPPVVVVKRRRIPVMA
jgi:hypothetical protein